MTTTPKREEWEKWEKCCEKCLNSWGNKYGPGEDGCAFEDCPCHKKTEQREEWECRKDEHKTCFCDKCLALYYNQPCSGCPEGHASFWKTVIESPQWEKWKKYAQDKMLYDFPEVEETGVISAKHFQDFMTFTLSRQAKEIRKGVEKMKIDVSSKVKSDDFVSNIALKEVQKHEWSYNEAIDDVLKTLL